MEISKSDYALSHTAKNFFLSHGCGPQEFNSSEIYPQSAS